ncbi:MAG: winged helix-turn-helix domain-containing protein [Rhodothermales bacterium]
MADKTTRRKPRMRRKNADTPADIKAFPKSLDKLIHERIRLGIVSALAASKQLSFSDLKELLDTSDGNLSVHARKLEDAGYIKVVKSFEGRTPKTEFSLLEKGRKALQAYLDQMEQIIKMTKTD